MEMGREVFGGWSLGDGGIKVCLYATYIRGVGLDLSKFLSLDF